MLKIGRISDSWKPGKLFIDLDYPAQPQITRTTRILALAGFRIQWLEIRHSQSGKGWHVIIQIKNGHKLSAVETVVLQLLCGSDFKREAINFMRARNLKGKVKIWQQNFNILFDEKSTINFTVPK